MFMEGSCG